MKDALFLAVILVLVGGLVALAVVLVGVARRHLARQWEAYAQPRGLHLGWVQRSGSKLPCAEGQREGVEVKLWRRMRSAMLMVEARRLDPLPGKLDVFPRAKPSGDSFEGRFKVRCKDPLLAAKVVSEEVKQQFVPCHHLAVTLHYASGEVTVAMHQHRLQDADRVDEATDQALAIAVAACR